MSATQRSYIVKEMFIGGFISLALSLLFVFVIFDADQAVAVFGSTGLLVDVIPQTLAITFMATLMPAVLTRKRLKKGAINLIDGRYTRLPQNLFIRSITLAVVVALCAFLLHFIAFVLIGLDQLPFNTALILKACYGALLGAGVAYYALVSALSSGPPVFKAD